MNQTPESTSPDSSPSEDPRQCVPPYLDRISDLLRELMPDAWLWAGSDDLADEDAEAIRLELLRSSIRLDGRSHSQVYDLADAAAGKLGLDGAITIYQQQNPIGWNAAALPLGDAAHLVLHGPLIKELSDAELSAVLAHELGHVLLWKLDDGKHSIASRLLESLANDATAATAHLESARMAKLYAEVFCDRMALQVVGDPHVVIASLLKIGTQSGDVDSANYLKQAEEIFVASKDQTSRHDTHPEMYIRAKSIQAWASKSEQTKLEAEATVSQMIQGQCDVRSLELVAQSELSGLTRRVLDAIFDHRWLRTEAALAHAKLFFDDYQTSSFSDSKLKALSKEIAGASSSVKQYVCYLLLDFATSDRECEDYPLAMAMDLAERFSLLESFEDLAKKELRLRVKQIRDLNKNKNKMLAAVKSEGVKSK
ncbi:MAG: M48 family metalloprotease [Pirellulaceae bacterium]